MLFQVIGDSADGHPIDSRATFIRRHRSASLALPTTWPTMPSADFCSAVRSPFDNLSRRSDTEQISWGKFSRLPCTIAESTLRTLDGTGLRGKLPARPALGLISGFCSSTRTFDPCFFQ